MSVVIVDTGCANLASIRFAYQRLGVDAIVSDNGAQIAAAPRVILPGVGSAPYAMRQIIDKGLQPILQNLKQPVLGICLGMQILFEALDEGAKSTQGLGLVPGAITKLDTKGQPSPHMGWNTLAFHASEPILSGITNGDYVYFVHSFAAAVCERTIASCEYGTQFAAIVRHQNIYACQFHPERSGAVGARILANFLEVPT
ncbi:MAG: imidazole glycerol phosphate synthase subunit HisH [Robiginitomaculum sp.]|nr:imidazole glycerol phosphate synthase subunit HisH [Robiginitomaculum sp.]